MSMNMIDTPKGKFTTYEEARKANENDLINFVLKTKYHGGECYNLNKIMILSLEEKRTINKNKRKRKLPLIETKNRLSSKLIKFNQEISTKLNLNDQIYYLVAWIKGLIRRRHAYDSSSMKKDWRLVPFCGHKCSWALLAWTDNERPVLYSTASRHFLEYKCAIYNKVVIDQTFYNQYNPIIKYYQTNRQLLKIMQLAYNLHATKNLIKESDVAHLYTLIAFEEPYFEGHEFDMNLKDEDIDVISSQIFGKLKNIFTTGIISSS